MTRLPLAIILLGAAAVAGSPERALTAQGERVPIVAVTGCLGEQGANWVLTNATEPVPSVANAPPAGQPMAGPT